MKIKAKIYTNNGEKENTFKVTFEEVGNCSKYGCGQYIVVTMPNGTEYHEDYRYMIGYNLKGAAEDWIKSNYKNAFKWEFIE